MDLSSSDSLQKNLNDILMHLSPSLTDAITNSQLRNHTILFEYKLVQTYGTHIGTYLVPQFDDINVWHGIIFVRNGLYKNGKFKFEMTFPSTFPLEPPQIKFKQHIYHPLIDYETGKLDLKKLFKEWKYGSTHLVYTLINEIKNIFLDISFYQITDSYNQQAALAFTNDIETFVKNIVTSVNSSIQNIFENDAKTSLRFAEYNSVHEKIHKQLSNIASDKKLSFEDKKKRFMKQLFQISGETNGNDENQLKQINNQQNI
ncbi:hypothetical protein ABPG72_018086 [Tetrahymena utriculariae]